MKSNEELLVDDIATTKKKRKNVESEEKLSMTRELKFKDLQDKIDEEEADRIVTEAIKKSKSKPKKKIDDTFERELDELLEKETKRVKKKKESKHEKMSVVDLNDEVKVKKVDLEDDLYLTTSFKPFRKRFKLSKLLKFLFKTLFLLALLVAFAYFVILPLFNMLNDSKPKVIFDKSLDYIQESINNFFGDDVSNIDKFSYKFSFNVDGNMEEISNVIDSDFVFAGAVDAKRQAFDASFFVNSKDTNYGYSILEREGTNYINFSTSDVYIKDFFENSDSSLIEKYFESLDDMSRASSSEYKYYVDKIVKTLKKLITEDDLIATKEEITIDGVTSNVVRNSLKLDKKRIEKLERDISKILIKDKKFLEIEAKISETSVDEVEKSYNEFEQYGEDYLLTFNIYTVKGNKFAGFDIEENGFRNIYYYNIDNKLELHLNLSSTEECRNGGDCAEADRMILDFVGTKKEGEIIVDLLFNNEDVGSLIFNEFSEEKIDFDYKLIIADIMYEGNIYIKINEKEEKIELGFSFELDDEHIVVNILYDFNTGGDVIDFDTSKALEMSTDVLQKEVDVFNYKLKADGVLDKYTFYQYIIAFIGSMGTETETPVQDSI